VENTYVENIHSICLPYFIGATATITSAACQSGERECAAQERSKPGHGDLLHIHFTLRVVGRSPKASSAWRSTSDHRTCLHSPYSHTQVSTEQF